MIAQGIDHCIAATWSDYRSVGMKQSSRLKLGLMKRGVLLLEGILQLYGVSVDFSDSSQQAMHCEPRLALASTALFQSRHLRGKGRGYMQTNTGTYNAYPQL